MLCCILEISSTVLIPVAQSLVLMSLPFCRSSPDPIVGDWIFELEVRLGTAWEKESLEEKKKLDDMFAENLVRLYMYLVYFGC